MVDKPLIDRTITAHKLHLKITFTSIFADFVHGLNYIVLDKWLGLELGTSTFLEDEIQTNKELFFDSIF